MKMLKLPEIKKMHPFIFVGLENNHNNPLISSVVSAIVKTTGIEFSKVQSHSRRREIVDARHLFCYFARKESKMSFKEIGDIINRDHASVMHASNKVKNLMEYDKEFMQKVPEITSLILEYERMATD